METAVGSIKASGKDACSSCFLGLVAEFGLFMTAQAAAKCTKFEDSVALVRGGTTDWDWRQAMQLPNRYNEAARKWISLAKEQLTRVGKSSATVHNDSKQH